MRVLWTCLLLGLGLGLFIWSSGPAHAQNNNCRVTPEGTVCSQQQPINVGALVDADEQRNLGLVTVNGGCSGTLISRQWVLTAQHCVTTGGTIGGALAAASSIAVTAAWSARRPTVWRIVDYFASNRLDVALLYLGPTDFGAAADQPLFAGPVAKDAAMRKYGRGMNSYATGSGPTAIPGQNDGRYRTADFTVNAASATAITLNANNAGQVGHGGDSGGPDWALVNGVPQGIASVQSTCQSTGTVAGAPGTGWAWATGIASCSSASVGNIRGDILTRIGRKGSNDFDGDGRGDILWYNAATGELQAWLMGVSSRIGRNTILSEDGRPALIGPPWSPVGSQNFNRDGKTDILWHNATTGETQIWHLNGAATLLSRATVVGEDRKPIFVGLPWRIAATSDMNDDGNADIIWHNGSTGETQVWLLAGSQIIRRVTVFAENGSPILIGPPWSIVGSNDFGGDKSPDIVWHNATTGEIQVWTMNMPRIAGRLTVRGETGATALVGSPWGIAGTNDFDQDGRADILWHNGSTGETQMWLMNGSAVVRRITVDASRDGGGAMVGPPWGIVNGAGALIPVTSNLQDPGRATLGTNPSGGIAALGRPGGAIAVPDALQPLGPTQPPSAPPPNAVPATFALACQGGRGMNATLTGDLVTITYEAGPTGFSAGPVAPGRCTFFDRGLRAGEPLILTYSGDRALAFFNQVKAGAGFQAQVYNNGQGQMVAVSIDALPVPSGPPAPTPVPGVVPPPAAPGFAAATVTQILNVRSGPGAQFAVIGVLDAGTQVRVSSCQAGWCRLAQPVAAQVGWVAQQYLLMTGSQGGSQVGAPAG